MQLSTASLLSSLYISLSAASAAAAAASLTITIPASAFLPNPLVLPAGTHATLTTLPSSEGAAPQSSRASHNVLTAPLTRSSTFVFRNLPSESESYLLDIRSPEYIFAPYRVDVSADGAVKGVWETFRGNTWDNRGADKFVAAGAAADVTVEAKTVGRRKFYEERAKCEFFLPFLFPLIDLLRANGYCFSAERLFSCLLIVSPLGLFKNPMILLSIVALGITVGMPKLLENSTCYYYYYYYFRPSFAIHPMLTQANQRAFFYSGPGNARGVREALALISTAGQCSRCCRWWSGWCQLRSRWMDGRYIIRAHGGR